MPEPANETEVWDRVFDGVRAENAAASIHGAPYIDPSRVAQANELSRRLGIPAALVEADVPGYEAQARRQAASAQARENPTYARMMSNPRFAAAATGDTAVPRIAQWVAASLARSAGGADPFAVVRDGAGWRRRSTQEIATQYAQIAGQQVRDSLNHNALGDFAITAWSTANAGAAGALNATYDLLTLRTFGAKTPGELIQDQLRDDIRQHGAPTTERGREIARSLGIDPDHPEQAPAELDPVRRYFQQAQQISTATAAAHRVRTGNEYIDAALNGLESVPLQLTAIGAAAAGRPDVGLTMMATITGGQAYGEAQAAGLSPARSLVYAGIQGGLEAAGELLPVFRFADDAARGSGFLRTLMGQFLTEVPGEQFTQHLQDLNTWAAIEANQGKTFGDYLAERPRVARDTFIATIAAVGLQTSTGHAIVRAARRASEAQTTLETGRSIDQLMAHAADSPTRKVNPSDFEEVLSGVLQDAANENLYIPAAQVRALFQSPEDMAADTFWGDYAPQITEAEALNGDVVVPLATAVTHLAGTPQWEALKDHVRTSGGGMSVAEARDAGPELLKALTEQAPAISEELAAQNAAAEPRQRIFDQMREKLEGAGFTPGVASQYAEMFASRAATRAQRLGRGLTGGEADSLDVRSGESSGAAGARVLTQSQTNRGGRDVPVQRNGAVALNSAMIDAPMTITFEDARQAFNENVRQAKSALASGETVTFNRASKALFSRSDQFDNSIRFALIPHLPEIVSHAVAYGEAPGVSGSGRTYVHAAARVTLNGREMAVRMTLYHVGDDSLRQFQLEGFEVAEARAGDLPPEGVQKLAPEPSAAKSVADVVADFNNRRLFQDQGGAQRGRIAFDTSGSATIDLFKSRDLSTFIHESGHLYLEELKADAELGAQLDTPEGKQLAADYEEVKAWFASQGHPIGDDGTIPTEAHELWARGFERYAMEGKAPSSGLRRAFEAFRSWLLNIYKNVKSLRAPITPEIRDVMQRLMATDEEIASAKVEQAIMLGFTSAKDAGMTDAEFAAYRDQAAEATSAAHDTLLQKVMATVRAARTKEYRANEAAARADVAEKIDAQPVFRALARLRDKASPVKLDRQFLLDTYGADALDQMPRSVPPIYGDTNTIHPDILAEESGFKSGDEMIRTLMAHEQTRQEMRANGDKRTPRQAQIDEATAKVMAEEYGDPLRDGSIEEEARAIIHNDKQGEVFATELRALARTSGKKPTPYRIAKQWAAEKIAAGQVASVASGSAIQRFARAAAKAGREFEQALAKGDRNEAFKQKQAQMLNNALVSASREAKDRIDVAVRRLGKLARAKTRASMDQDYLDQIHGLLEQVEFRPRSQASLKEQESYEAWAEEQRKAGIDLVQEPSFAASLGTTHWSRLSVEQLVGLDDTVQQIAHLGRLKQTLLDGDARRKFDEVLAEAEDAAGKLPPKTPSDLMEPGFGERLKGKVASFDAALLKMETVFDWLDSKNSAGVFNRIVFKPIADAQTRAADMFADYMSKLNEALAAVPKSDLRRWGDRVTPPELLNRQTGNPYTLTRQQLVSMALNMGNEGNAQRLADGYGWNDDAIMAVLNRELSPDEWRYVQSVWDIIDGLWPHIEVLERTVNGVSPDKVQARPLETSAGPLRGGYFPAVYDSSKDYAAERNAARESDLFETTYTRATTRASATKERADKVSRPILLNLGVITRHVGEITHDIAFREAVMNADKFLSHPRVMAAVDSTLGPEIRKQFRPWLKFVANQWAMERAGNEGIGAFMNKLRTNTTVVGMGYRFSTMTMQLAGYSNSFEVVGAKWVSAAVAQTSAHPVETFKFVMDRSGEMRHRMDTLDRDIDQGIRRLAGKTNPLTEAKRFAYHGIGYMDRMVAIPTWIGAYNKALASGSTDEEAIYEADKAVRQSQGAGAAKDMAAVQRGTGKWGEALKLMTMFYSYLSAVWQRQRTLGRDVRNAKPRDLPGIAARAWWLIVLPPVLSELLGGRGPDDDDDWTAWALKQMLFQALGPIPVVRDIARPAWDKAAGNRAFDYQLSPVQRAGQSAVNVAGDLGRLWRGEDTAHATRDVMEAAGYWTGLVPGQFASATQFLVDVGSGDAEPENLGDWYTGLTTGRLPAH